MNATEQRSRDPRAGYARDFVTMIEQGARDIVERGVKVIANAGGVNPEGCREAVKAGLAKQNLAGRLRIGVVTGDDISVFIVTAVVANECATEETFHKGDKAWCLLHPSDLVVLKGDGDVLGS